MLAALAAALLFADPPALKAAELLKSCSSFEGKTVRVRGSIVERRTCPPCPQHANCKPCLSYMDLATLPELKGPGTPKRIRIDVAPDDRVPDAPETVEVEGVVAVQTDACLLKHIRTRVEGKVLFETL